MPKKTKAKNMTVAEVHAYLGKLIADGKGGYEVFGGCDPYAPARTCELCDKEKICLLMY